MRSATFFDHPPLAMPVDVQGYNIEFDQSEGQATLTLVGDLGGAATDALRGLLGCIADGPGVLHVDAGGVLGADLDAFDPLLELARERWRQHQPGVVLDSLSETVRDLFDALGVPTEPPVELDAAWLSSEVAS
ncbi:MAG TPA: STAS domain-containing protein [Jatrophihabitantaceae bacterium]